MSPLRFELIPTQDGLEVLIRVLDEDGAVAEGLADATDLDELIANLGEVRAGLTDQVPERLEPSGRVPAVRDPAWWCQARKEDTALCLRHPGYGWVAFGLPHHEAKALGDWLIKGAEDEAPAAREG